MCSRSSSVATHRALSWLCWVTSVAIPSSALAIPSKEVTVRTAPMAHGSRRGWPWDTRLAKRWSKGWYLNLGYNWIRRNHSCDPWSVTPETQGVTPRHYTHQVLFVAGQNRVEFTMVLGLQARGVIWVVTRQELIPWTSVTVIPAWVTQDHLQELCGTPLREMVGIVKAS